MRTIFDMPSRTSATALPVVKKHQYVPSSEMNDRMEAVDPEGLCMIEIYSVIREVLAASDIVLPCPY